MKRFFENFYKVTRVIIIILPFLILGLLIKKDLVLSGHLEFIYDFSHDSPVITNLFPASRLLEIYQIKDRKEFFQQILEEPVYFEVRLPQKFETATVEITYQNVNQPLIQVGLRTLGREDWNYNFKPLENQFLDRLDWFKIEESRGTIWQRQKKYLTWNQFFSEADNFKDHIAYDYNLKNSAIPLWIDYLVNIYQTPKQAGGWKVGKVKFDLNNAAIANRKVRFALSAPKLNNSGQTIPLKSIKVVFDKKPLTYREIFKKSLSYIKEQF